MKYGAPEYADWNTLEPLEGMANENADVTLILVQPNSLLYQTPVDDPFFSAHRPIVGKWTSFGDDGALGTWFAADSPVSAFGCEVQVGLKICDRGVHPADLFTASILLQFTLWRETLHCARPIARSRVFGYLPWSQRDADIRTPAIDRCHWSLRYGGR